MKVHRLLIIVKIISNYKGHFKIAHKVLNLDFKLLTIKQGLKMFKSVRRKVLLVINLAFKMEK